MKKKIIIGLVLSSIALISSCKKKGCTDELASNYEEDAKKDDDSCDFYDETKSAVKTTYANIVYATYKDSYDKAVELKTAIDNFVAAPSANGFTTCKTKWKEAREPYGQTEAFRFAGGPIDNEDGPEGLLNAWPLDENYVDYVDGDNNAGIINDVTVTIDAATLESLNEAGGEANVSIGYHAIEFLLWGQDDSDASLLTSGQREYTDYLTDGNGTASNQDRRGAYLKVCADLLIDHLKLMVDEWDASQTGNYRNTFLALDNDVALQNIMTGIGTLSKSELAGERIFVALDNQSQEDEHSCFSDNTHRDIIQNAQGIRNVYLGEYTATDGTTTTGTGLQDLISLRNSTLTSEMNTLSSSSITNTEAIQVPFDNALTAESAGGSGSINTSISTLVSQGDKIVEIASEFNISVNTDL